MSDAELRTLERAWRALPSDFDAQSRWVAALARSGRPIPPWAIDHLRYPAQVFDLGGLFAVGAELPDLERGVRSLGVSAPETPIEVPEHHVWWIAPERGRAGVPDCAAVVRQHGVPGLLLARGQVDSKVLNALRDVPSLTWLSLAGCRRLDAAVPDLLARQLPQLRHLDLSQAPGRVRLGPAHLEAWPNLSHLLLRHACGDREARLIARHARRLTRLRIGGPNLTGAGLAAIAGLPWLSRLEVGFAPQIGRGDLGVLTELPRLQHLDLVACQPFEAADLAQLMEAPELSSLGFFPGASHVWGFGRAASPEELSGLGELAQLSYLSVSSGPASRPSGQLTIEQAELESALEDCEVEFVASPSRRGALDRLHAHGPPVGRGLMPRD